MGVSFSFLCYKMETKKIHDYRLLGESGQLTDVKCPVLCLAHSRDSALMGSLSEKGSLSPAGFHCKGKMTVFSPHPADYNRGKEADGKEPC